MTTTPAIVAALAPALATSTRGRALGCCRVYVCLMSKTDRKVVTAVSAACKKLGKIFQRKAYYGLSNAIYVGYDTCTGVEVGRGEAVVAALATLGIEAYTEFAGD